MAPLLYINENGSVYGVLADMMRFIAESFDHDLEYVTYQLPVEALSALDGGEVDAVDLTELIDGVLLECVV